MIQKMIAAYGDFIKKYGFLPAGFILSGDVYSAFRKELREMYPSTDDIQEIKAFMGLPVCISSVPCDISFQVQPNNAARFSEGKK